LAAELLRANLLPSHDIELIEGVFVETEMDALICNVWLAIGLHTCDYLVAIPTGLLSATEIVIVHLDGLLVVVGVNGADIRKFEIVLNRFDFDFDLLVVLLVEESVSATTWGLFCLIDVFFHDPFIFFSFAAR